MKRIMKLLLAVGLILGLSATAFAAGEGINFDGSSTSTVSYDGTITIKGTISNYDSNAAYSLTCDKSTDITLSGDSFTCRANAGSFSPGTNVTFTFILTNDSDVSFVNPKPTYTVTIQEKPKSDARDITRITVDGSNKGVPSTSQTYEVDSLRTSVDITIECSDKAKVNVGYAGVTEGAKSFKLDLGYADSAASVGFSVIVTAENGDTKLYNFTIKRPAPSLSSVNTLKTLTIGGTAKTISNSISHSVGNSTSSVNISATATEGGATVRIYNVTTGAYVGSEGNTATANSTALAVGVNNFRVEVTPANKGTGKNYTIAITRATATATTYINSVTLKSGSTSGSTVGSAVGAVTSTNVSSSRSITIPASLRSTTTFVAVVALPSGTISNATITGTSTSASRSGNNVTLTIPSNITSATLSLTVPGYSSTIPITITRETSNAILKSVTFSYSGSTLSSVGAVSGNNTQNVGLNTTATSANVSWVLADGATLASATWNNSNTSSGSSIGLPSGSSTRALVLKINASNGTQYTATFNVSSSGTTSLANTLDSLYIKSSATSSINSGYLYKTSPSTFRSNTTAYDVYVEEDVDTIYVYPTPNNSGASVSISGNYKDSTDRYSSNGYFIVDLRSSNNTTINVRVTANGTTTTYTLNIEREDEVVTNASLDSLYVSKSSTSTSSGNRYNLEPSFSNNRTKYEVSIPRSISEVYLHLETHRSDADLSVSGASKVSDGVYRATLNTNRTKTVTVTVEYRNDETEYTINLNSGSASSYAQLSRIRVAERESNSSSYQYTLLPEFDSSITDYVVLIPYENSGNYVYVQATLDDDGDELRIDGEDVDSGTWLPVDITRGKKVSVPIRVTDDDDNTTTYDLQIVAAARNASDDADLDRLSLRTGSSSSSEITLSPSFSHNTTKYTAANVANSYSTLRVYAEPSDNDAWIIVNDVLMTGSYAEVDLDEGKNTIEVVVYAADCETSETYTIAVTRGTGGGSDTTLSGLEARYGTSNVQTLNLIPAFAKNTTTYRINVDGTVAQVAFKATTTDDTATIKIMGKDEVSGQWSSYNGLSNGENTFLIVVTSGDGKNHTYYTVSVVRGISVVVSSQKLRVNGADVTCAAYNINGNNYFKLRDIAYALRGTPKRFDVTYNSVTRNISMVSGRDYSPIGGEMVRTVAAGKYQLSNQAVIKDGVSVILTAYNVDGNNYFMLREIGQLFNFGVDYDSSNSLVMIDTSKIYVPGS